MASSNMLVVSGLSGVMTEGMLRGRIQMLTVVLVIKSMQ